jgi:hypothetical protein
MISYVISSVSLFQFFLLAHALTEQTEKTGYLDWSLTIELSGDDSDRRGWIMQLS